MIKAIFFDWFNTLAHYQPPREELQSQALQEFGFHISPQEILPALLAADKDFFRENAISPLRERSPAGRSKIFTQYQKTMLTMVGIDVTHEPDLPAKMLKRMEQLFQGMRFTLFNDVLPTLKKLKAQNLRLGLLTNLDRDITPICQALGLGPFLNFIVTAGEVGSDKPEPPIFLTALERAKVKAVEAIHVGDQYHIDIIGARGVGITPLLLDRYNLYPEVSDCPRIHSLTELAHYL